MIFLGEAIFHWRSNGPDLLTGAIVTLAVAGLGYFACRHPKGRIAGVVVFGLWVVYVPFVFIGSRIWPDEILISAGGIRGRHNFSPFAVETSDIRSIRGTRDMKGAYALHVFLKSDNTAIGIPVIREKDKDAYKAALRQLCTDADLDW